MNPVKIERRGHIMLIMLNRPKDRNAVNQFMAEELYVAFKAFESDKTIKAGIICSSGDSFCSGYDEGDLYDQSYISNGYYGLVL